MALYTVWPVWKRTLPPLLWKPPSDSSVRGVLRITKINTIWLLGPKAVIRWDCNPHICTRFSYPSLKTWFFHILFLRIHSMRFVQPLHFLPCPQCVIMYVRVNTKTSTIWSCLCFSGPKALLVIIATMWATTPIFVTTTPLIHRRRTILFDFWNNLASTI